METMIIIISGERCDWQKLTRCIIMNFFVIANRGLVDNLYTNFKGGKRYKTYRCKIIMHARSNKTKKHQIHSYVI